jgi:hypothetical protein
MPRLLRLPISKAVHDRDQSIHPPSYDAELLPV